MWDSASEEDIAGTSGSGQIKKPADTKFKPLKPVRLQQLHIHWAEWLPSMLSAYFSFSPAGWERVRPRKVQEYHFPLSSEGGGLFKS